MENYLNEINEIFANTPAGSWREAFQYYCEEAIFKNLENRIDELKDESVDNLLGELHEQAYNSVYEATKHDVTSRQGDALRAKVIKELKEGDGSDDLMDELADDEVRKIANKLMGEPAQQRAIERELFRIIDHPQLAATVDHEAIEILKTNLNIARTEEMEKAVKEIKMLIAQVQEELAPSLKTTLGALMEDIRAKETDDWIQLIENNLKKSQEGMQQVESGCGAVALGPAYR